MRLGGLGFRYADFSSTILGWGRRCPSGSDLRRIEPVAGVPPELGLPPGEFWLDRPASYGLLGKNLFHFSDRGYSVRPGARESIVSQQETLPSTTDLL